MYKNPAIKLLHCICVGAALLFSQGFINTVFAQSQNLGDFRVQLLPDWSYSSEKSSGDFYVFINSQQKIEVSLKKEPAPCLNAMDFTKLILPVIQNFQKEQWIIEQRKPAVPYSFAGQKTCHFMKLKSRATGQLKFVLNPLVKTKIYPTSAVAADAGAVLCLIDPDSKCYAETKGLNAKMEQKVQKVEIRDWKFTERVWGDNVALEKLRIKAYRDIGVAIDNNQQPTYNNILWAFRR